MKYFKIAAIGLILVINSSQLFAQEKGIKFRVGLDITANDIFEDRLYSEIGKRLREFDDVAIMPKESAYDIIEIVAIKNGGMYICSLVVNSPITFEELAKTAAVFELRYEDVDPDDPKYEKLQKEKIEEQRETLLGYVADNFLADAKSQRYHGVFTDGSLYGLADRIVATVDTEIFNRFRKMNNEIQDEIKE